MLPYSQLRTGGNRIDLASAIPLDKPLTVYVEPTNVCNLSCDFCPQSIDDYKERAGYYQHIDIDLYRKVIDEIKELGIKSLKLYFFGEPLMHPRIGDICLWAGEVCDRVELTSNAIPFTERKAREILNSNIAYLRVSWYGEKPEKVRENIATLWRLRKELGKDKPYICIKVFDPEAAEIVRRDFAGISDEIAVEQLHTIGSDFVHLRSYSGPQIACPYPFYNLVVKSNGDVVPCCVAWEKSLVVGNVKEESLLSIWRGERLANVQRLHLAGRSNELAACAKCDTIFNCPDSVDGVSVEEYERRKAAKGNHSKPSQPTP